MAVQIAVVTIVRHRTHVVRRRRRRSVVTWIVVTPTVATMCVVRPVKYVATMEIVRVPMERLGMKKLASAVVRTDTFWLMECVKKWIAAAFPAHLIVISMTNDAVINVQMPKGFPVNKVFVIRNNVFLTQEKTVLS